MTRVAVKNDFMLPGHLLCSASHTIVTVGPHTVSDEAPFQAEKHEFSFQQHSPGWYDQGFGGIACWS